MLKNLCLSITWMACGILLVLAVQSGPAWGQVSASIAAEVKVDEIDDDQRFVNAQGTDGTNTFVSYGVLEFDTTSLAGTLSIPAVKFSLAQDNAFFTANGTIEWFLTEDTTTDISVCDAGAMSCPLLADETVVPNGIAAGDLSPLTSLGTGAFVETNNGDIDMFTFPVGAAAETYLLGRIGGGDPIRFVFAAADATVAATYAATAGGSDDEMPAPTFQIVPEPATCILAVLGFAILLRRRR